MWAIAGQPRGIKDEATGRYVYRFEVPSAAGPPYRCAAVCMGDMGPGQATDATHVLLRGHPRTLVNLGIAAAIHDDLKLCDVVVADQIDDYLATTKATPRGKTGWAFELRGSVYKTSYSLVQDVENLKFAHPEAYAEWRSACAAALADHAERLAPAIAAKQLRAVPGVIRTHLASGPVLAAAESFATWVRKRDSSLKALEMEAAGMMLAVQQRSEATATLVLRGISDYGDSRKAQTDRESGGAFRHLAMVHATRLLWAMMRHSLLPRHPPADTPPRPGTRTKRDATTPRRGSKAATVIQVEIARYRHVMAVLYGSMRFIGIPHAANSPGQAIRDGFVPLKLRRAESRTTWTPTRLLKLLLGPRGETRHILAIGAPGAGKTTLCRFLTTVLAGAIALEGLDIPADLVPLHLVVREYDVGDLATPAILAHLERSAGSRGAPMAPGRLEFLCKAGRAVLLVDGLDEAGDATRREEFRGRILAFCKLYPRVPVFITTRGVGYDEVRLPNRGPAGFLHLKLDPFDDEDLPEFVRRWYAALDLDEATRAAGVADLLASFAAEPTVRELARVPLLGTLIALIHRYNRLPNERVKLYDLCIRMLLHDWPGARDRPFMEIDLDIQRTVLAAIAVRFDEMRGGSTLVPRAVLVDFVTTALQTYEPEAGHTRVRARRWIEYLHDESGLLSESGPDQLAFVHRTLQEYLAAVGFVRWNEDPTAVIAAHRRQAEAREVLLMMVGLLAADTEACERLARQVAADDDDSAWSFLLACMGEEAGFSVATQINILTQAARVARDPARSAAIAAAMTRVWRFSRRHGATVHRWFMTRLADEREHLAAFVWLACAAALDCEHILARLDARPDRAWVAAEVGAAFWPVDPDERDDRTTLRAVARWAWSRLTLPETLAHMTARRWSASDLCGVAYTSLTAGITGAIRGAVTLQLSRDALELARCAAMRPPGAREGSLVTRPGEQAVAVATRAPVATAPQDALGPPPTADRHHELSPHRLTQRAIHFPPGLGDQQGFDANALAHPALSDIDTFQYLVGPDAPSATDFWNDPYYEDRFVDHGEIDEYGDVIDSYDDFGNSYPVKEFMHDIVGDLTGLELVRTPEVRPIAAPDAPRCGDPYHFREALVVARRTTGEDSPPFAAAFALHSLHAAHVSAAASLFADDPSLQRHAAVLRQQHVWLLQNWHVLERLADASDDPTTLALLLALGWVQCTSTSTWPGTPSWRVRFAGPAPTHWWPRVHWHLCWLLHAPDLAAHRVGLDAALAEGASDEALAPLAAGLRGVLAS